MMKYYLPPYIPIYKSKNKLCIGFAHLQDKYCEFEYTDSLHEYIQYILLNGIEMDNDNLFLRELKNRSIIKTKTSLNSINRGMLFLEYLGNEKFDIEVRKSSILIFGAGAGGGTLTYLLAQFGFENITVVDFDIVERSDVLRTSVYDLSQEGMMKVDALSCKIKSNFGVDLKTHFFDKQDYESLNRLIDSVNPELVVKACDPNLNFRINLNKICLNKKIAHFHMAYAFEDLKIGPLYIPNYLGCDNCLNLNIQEIYGEHYNFESHERLFSDILIHPSISFNINILASLALKELLFFLTGNVENCFSIGRIVEFSPMSLTHRVLEVRKNSLCSICKSEKS
jgi:molybdopterin/thiamine biosynthesis adenylyltransferase